MISCRDMRLAAALGVIGFGGLASASPLFDSDEVLDVRISGPFEAMFDADDTETYRPFSIEHGGRSQQIRIRLRGHSRLRVCNFPPLRLNFSKEQLEGGVFQGQDKLKLVTHCRNSDRGEQDLLEEYAAYRILNIMTEASYRVRLFRIDYADTSGKLPGGASPRFGFVIESDHELARRIGATPVSLTGMPIRRHDEERAALMYVFHYLIANTDWSLVTADSQESCCHNGDLFELDSKIIFIPYDFDLAGLVNARYAKPDPSLNIKRVTQRVYRGLCNDRETMRAALRAFAAKRAEILAVPDNVPGLEPANIKRAKKYLNRFFDKVGDEDKTLDSFERSCLGG